MNQPISFPEQMYMNYMNMQPSSVKGVWNAATQRHKRYLYTKLYYVYKLTIPEQWPLNWFRFWLFQFGSIAAIYTKELGWFSTPYSVTGLDAYYQPSSISVANHLLKNVKAGKIGVNAEIIRIMDDYYSLDDLVTAYAEELAQIDKDFNVNLMNVNTALLAEAESPKKAAEIKEAYEEATTGKPLVVIKERKKGAQESDLRTMMPSPKSNYIGGELLQARRNVVNQFLTDIGIPNFNMEKRAQQNKDEISENDDETKAICTIIRDNVQQCFDRLKKISGLDCRIELRPEYRKEVIADGKADPMGDVPV